MSGLQVMSSYEPRTRDSLHGFRQASYYFVPQCIGELVPRRLVMKVISIRKPNGPLQLEDRTRPSPGVGELLLRVRACGICHGDVMAKMGAFPFVRFPIVPGHEIAATVEETGPNVEGIAVGDRVGLSVFFSSCGSCLQCKRGAENLCPDGFGPE
jgi:D-arabinose 1-dehydrogenase-like Zn-dependent alcohol dehydrogenase